MMASAAGSRTPTVTSRSSNVGRHGAPSQGDEQSRQPPRASANSRSNPVRLKATIRRLPPGLTEAEFEKALGDDWRVGGERVDWYSFKEGKVSRDISKSSEPGRAYLHLTKQEYLSRLSAAVRDSMFVDRKNTVADSCLHGPPIVELATYGRTPTMKPRKDARQGTIDQDPEFMNFLQALTNPILKPTPIDAQASERAGAKTGEAVTPLIQFLRDKKSNKDRSKEQAHSKSGKQGRQESKDTKGPAPDKIITKSKGAKETAPAAGSEKRPASVLKAEKPREPVKILSKQGANAPKSSQNQAASSSKGQVAVAEARPPSTPSERKQKKVGVEAKSLLQRDLGIGSSGRRKRADANPATPSGGSASKAGTRRESSGAQTAQAQAGVSNDSEQLATSVPLKTSQSGTAAHAKGSSPQNAVLTPSKDLTATAAASNSSPMTVQGASPGSPGPASGTATQAFLKHANASQGVTESLLLSAMSAFGQVSRVDIDKKKGFAYVDFSSHAGLRAAMAASPVKVGQGSVVVLERREKPSKSDKGAKGGSATPVRPATGTTESLTDKAATTTAPNASSVSTSSAGSRGGTPKSHRPRGNRGRGLGRGGAGNSGEKAAIVPSQSQGLEGKGQ